LQDRAWRRVARQGIEIAELFYPFENQPWEKVLNRRVAEGWPGAQRYGYQHAIVSDLYLGHYDRFSTAKEKLYPHRIYTNGPLFFEKLKKYYPALAAESKAYRFGYLFRTATTTLAEYQARGQVILLVLPAARGLCREIIVKVYNAFKETDYQVWIKGHPSWSDNGPVLVPGEKLPSNFTIIAKGQCIPDLLGQVKYLFYTDSTASLEALANGVPVVQVVSERGFDYDFVPAHLKKMGISPAELSAAVREYQQKFANEQDYEKFLTASGDFIRQCFNAPTAISALTP